MIKGIRISNEGRRPWIEQRCALRRLYLLVHDGFRYIAASRSAYVSRNNSATSVPHSNPTGDEWRRTPAGPPRLRLFIAQRPPDNKQRLNQQDQVRKFLDQLLDTGLVLGRPDLATLSGGSARSATRMYSSMDEILRIDSYSSGANLERCTS